MGAGPAVLSARRVIFSDGLGVYLPAHKILQRGLFY